MSPTEKSTNKRKSGGKVPKKSNTDTITKAKNITALIVPTKTKNPYENETNTRTKEKNLPVLISPVKTKEPMTKEPYDTFGELTDDTAIAMALAVADVEKQELYNRNGCQVQPHHYLVEDNTIVGFLSMSEKCELDKQHWLIQASQISAYLNLNLKKGTMYFHSLDATKYPLLTNKNFQFHFSSTSIKRKIFGPDNIVYQAGKSAFNACYLRFIIMGKTREVDVDLRRTTAVTLVETLTKEVIKLCQGDKFTIFYIKIMKETMESYVASDKVRRAIENISDIFKKMILRDSKLLMHFDLYLPVVTIEDILKRYTWMCKKWVEGPVDLQFIIQKNISRGWVKQKIERAFLNN